MDPVERSSLVDRTEAVLLSGIRDGVWADTLPGVRLLSETLKVSPPTLQAATKRLLDRGVLISDGPRRRLRISEEAVRFEAPERDPEGDGRKRILCLSSVPLEQMAHTRLEMLTGLQLECPHWDLRQRVLPFTDARSPRRQWDRLLATEDPDALIVFGGREAIAAWIERRGLRAVFIGGDAGPHPIPAVGMDARGLLRKALAELIRHGHREICMPILGVFDRLQDALRETFAEEMAAAGLPFDPAWNTPVAPQHEPDLLLNTLHRVCRAAVPTAFIPMSWDEFVLIQSFLSRQRLVIPEDVSVILLSPGGSLNWFHPPVTHFTHGISRVAGIVRGWIDSGFPTDFTPIPVPTQLVQGGSVAPPRPRPASP